MKRSDLEHLIRASSAITNEYEFVVIGSQAILGSDPNPPQELTVSAEADIYPLHRPELNERIEGAIGEFSEFHASFGFYAQGVDATTATLPQAQGPHVLHSPAPTQLPHGGASRGNGQANACASESTPTHCHHTPMGSGGLIRTKRVRE